ncbi:MAG: hypothetical protein J0L93_06640 [Deltaproteobacteria bacterium]|nr:hypothetical protein [Deltaproteobacteria bacterium]
MAKDEVLFKFLSARVDPAILVDHALQSEREALDLAEMSLLELVDEERMQDILKKSADKIQHLFQNIFGDDRAKEFISEDLLNQRMLWLRVRVEFYRKWLSYSEKVNSPTELAVKTFRSTKNFDANLNRLFKAEKDFAEETVSATHSLHRFLMRKQLDHEIKSFEDIWTDFKVEAFKKFAELPE